MEHYHGENSISGEDFTGKKLPSDPESNTERIGGEGKSVTESGVQPHPDHETGVRPLPDKSGAVDWREVWRVVKPLVNIWLVVFWLLLVMPNAWDLKGLITVLRELPLIMISFYFTGMAWVFYKLERDYLMVWLWVVNISLMLWIY